MTRKDFTCPCGSGLAYNECCGKPPKVVCLAQARLRKIARNIRRKLGEYANRQVFAKDAGRAQEQYFKDLDINITDYDDEFLLERCFEWFIFDYRLFGGEHIIDKFVNFSGLNHEEKLLSEKWTYAPTSLYEVITVYPGKGVLLQDVFKQYRMLVLDTNAVNDLSPGYILYMRVLPVGDENEFSTSGLALPPNCKDILIKKIMADARWFWSQYGEKDLNIYLRDRSHIVNSIVIQVSLDPGSEYLKFEQNPYQNDDYLDDDDSMLLLPDDFAWQKDSYKNVARLIIKDLHKFNYSYSQISNALRLWYDYSSQEKPSFRKQEIWVASIIYSIFRLEQDYKENQHTLSEKYGVSSSSISDKYRSIRNMLGLEDCDKRYSTCCRMRGKDNTTSILTHLFSKKK
ncbi:MAG: SEC-C domain-containing protein [Clostridiales bacterium]|nr:SEC-C domain-containing protein [Clostridiales bacterium]MCF8022370.1 SEC-C domain-containing protein [Clostridiales bacterium]